VKKEKVRQLEILAEQIEEEWEVERQNRVNKFSLLFQFYNRNMSILVFLFNFYFIIIFDINEVYSCFQWCF